MDVCVSNYGDYILLIWNMKLGDVVMVSPDLTQLKEWVRATVIDVEDNPFQGIVISAETEDGDFFFGVNTLFKLAA